jgi:hypothetical protein
MISDIQLISHYYKTMNDIQLISHLDGEDPNVVSDAWLHFPNSELTPGNKRTWPAYI